MLFRSPISKEKYQRCCQVCRNLTENAFLMKIKFYSSFHFFLLGLLTSLFASFGPSLLPFNIFTFSMTLHFSFLIFLGVNDPPPGTDEIIAMTKIVTFLEEGYLLPNGQIMVSTYVEQMRSKDKGV